MYDVEDKNTASACIVIERGVPYEKGIYVPLYGNKLIVGRTTYSFSPDVSFANSLISRKHCCLEHYNQQWTLSDLGSKHGTMVNGQPIVESKPYILRHGDRIVLASGVVIFHFMLSMDFEKTLEFDKTLPTKAINNSIVDSSVIVDMDKKTLLIDNQVISISVKEWLLLEVLYKCRNKFVSYEEIRTAVWAERYSPNNKLPDIGVEEINVLIYRLRKRLGTYGKLLRTIRGRGCIIEL